jgi:hypothetical protein
MSVFLMSSIAALAYIGVFDIHNFTAMPYFIKIIAFAVVFLALFFLIFLLLNLKRFSKRKKKAAAAAEAAPAGVTRHHGGLLASASRLSETSGQDVIYEENGVPYINSDLAKNYTQGALNRNFIKLVESVTGSPSPPPVPRQEDKPEKAHKSSQG